MLLYPQGLCDDYRGDGLRSLNTAGIQSTNSCKMLEVGSNHAHDGQVMAFSHYHRGRVSTAGSAGGLLGQRLACGNEGKPYNIISYLVES